jgi:2-keto-4-pentenoate hydratase
MTDHRVVNGTAAHLKRMREKLDAGEARVGWKIGLNPPAAQERAGISEPVVGHLTDSTVVASGGEYHGLAAASRLVVEPEIAVRIGEDGSIASIGPALEIVDVDRDIADIEPVLAGNIFHRGVVFGPEDERRHGGSLAGVTARVLHNGEVAGEPDPAAVVGDPNELVALVARTVASHGEELRPGDRIICGTLIPPLAPEPGDEIALDLGPLGTASVRFA